MYAGEYSFWRYTHIQRMSHGLLSAALSVLLLAGCVVSAQEFDQQAVSLLLLRGALDRSGVLTSWNPNSDVCTSWEGITCNDAGKVTTINLENKGLEGQLPLDESLWTNLNSLENINLAKNAITGFVPPQMSVLNSLEYISVSDNQLESILPVSWDVLASLKGVDLSQNKLFGDLPAEWSKLTNLEAIDLSENDFTGTIPESWSNLPNLGAASFAGNKGLCDDNPNAGSSDLNVYYGPCDGTSPTLPNINPAYPPAPTPPPVAPSPSPDAPIPSKSPAPGPKPLPSPPPVSKPSDFVNMNFDGTGMTEAELQSSMDEYKKIIAQAAKVPPGWIEVTVSSASPSSGSRRLLQNPNTLALSNKIYTDDQDVTIDSLNESVDSGSLTLSLRNDLGLLLVPGSVTIDKPSSTNVGAIVGGVVGGVCGLVIILIIIWFIMKRKRDQPLKASSGSVGNVIQGEKSGMAMYTSNPLAEEDTEENAMSSSKKEEFKMYEGGVYDQDSTPRSTDQAARTAAAVAKGVNPLSLQRSESDLSDPDSQRYGTPSDTTAPLTSRSRLDSARSGLQSNPAFATPREMLDSSDEEDINPMYVKSAGTAASSQSAGTGLEIDSSRKYESATESAKTTANMQSNPQFNVEEEEEQGGSSNPLFDMLKGRKK